MRRLKERLSGRRVLHQRRFAKPPRDTRRIDDVDETRAGDKVQFAAAEKGPDCCLRYTGGSRHFIDGKDFAERYLRHCGKRLEAKALPHSKREIRRNCAGN
jgi:hypothetical protein